jgi:hypothetical protein
VILHIRKLRVSIHSVSLYSPFADQADFCWIFEAPPIRELLLFFCVIWRHTSIKPVSQIHRFHLRLGYDAIAACFLVISVGGVRHHYCRSFFFYAAGAQFKALASFNFSLKFSECRRRAVQKMYRKVVERWLYGALTGTVQLFSSANTIFPPLRGTDCLWAPGGKQDCPHVPLESGRPGWRVWFAPGRGPVGPPSVPQLQERVPNNHHQVAVDY